MAYVILALHILVFYVVPVANLVLLVVLVLAVRRIGRTQRVDELILSMEVSSARTDFALDEATAQRLATALRLSRAWEAGELSRSECARAARAVTRAAEHPLVRDAADGSPFLVVKRFARHWTGA